MKNQIKNLILALVISVILFFAISTFANAKTKLNNEQIRIVVYILETFNVDRQDIKDIIKILTTDNKEIKMNNIKNAQPKRNPETGPTPASA